MGSLLIVTGPPGAGKTTVAAEVAKRDSPSVLVEGDRFFGFLASGAIEPWLPEANSQNDIVTRAAAAATGRFAAHYATVYDGVVGPWFLSTFAAATGLAELHYVVILPPADVCVARVDERVGHGFTDEAATRKMHAEFVGASIDARHVLDGATYEIAELADEVRHAQASGLLRYSTRSSADETSRNPS